MKRLLLLAYYFPPRIGVGGLRATYLAKYLPRFGWEVTVVTARCPSGAPPSWANVIETDYKDVVARAKRFLGVPPDMSTHAYLGSKPPKFDSMTLKHHLIGAGYSAVAFPDPHIGWLTPAQRTIADIFRTQRFDAILSTSYPYSAHIMGKRVSRRYQIPWIADLRDAWRGFHYHLSPNPLLLASHAILERITLSRATAVTTVSKPLANLIAKNNPKLRVVAIPNAFDPEEWGNIPFDRPPKLRFTYAGSLGHHNPEMFFKALFDELQAGYIQRDQVEFVFYGNRDYWLDKAIERYDLGEVVRQEGFVDRAVVLRAERATSANLLFLWDDVREVGMYTGKFFEYLGARRPILAVSGPAESVVRDVLKRTGGWYARTVPEIRQALRELYTLQLGGSELRLSDDGLNQFSADAMAGNFAELLDESTRPPRNQGQQSISVD